MPLYIFGLSEYTNKNPYGENKNSSLYWYRPIESRPYQGRAARRITYIKSGYIISVTNRMNNRINFRSLLVRMCRYQSWYHHTYHYPLPWHHGPFPPDTTHSQDTQVGWARAKCLHHPTKRHFRRLPPFFSYVKKIIPSAEIFEFPYVKISILPWKYLKKCQWN